MHNIFLYLKSKIAFSFSFLLTSTYRQTCIVSFVVSFVISLLLTHKQQQSIGQRRRLHLISSNEQEAFLFCVKSLMIKLFFLRILFRSSLANSLLFRWMEHTVSSSRSSRKKDRKKIISEQRVLLSLLLRL